MTRIRPGLCSVTLRAETVDAVARLAAECGMRGIEWGGDVHVPPGNLAAAVQARAASVAADLVVASYGSYLFAGSVPDRDEMETTLDTALTLGAPNVRVWAGFGVEPGSVQYRAVVDGLAAFCSLAEAGGLTVGLEFHGGTPTATVAGTRALLDAVGAPNLFTYWQPPYWRESLSPAADVPEVVALRSRLSHLHVYEWAGPDDRHPLAHGGDRWPGVLGAARAIDADWADDRYAFLEFVRDDAPDALRRDAAVLNRWLTQLDTPPASVA
ncbi:MAG: TIM barrel protein [Acidimicrobiia bacterium]